jgi:hypothetical protein
MSVDKLPRGDCFVISPIGKAGSDTRKRSDEVFEFIISPPIIASGYIPVRADHIAEPGMIDQQVLSHVVEDPLVVADLTDHNANVFYELSLRHALRKPTLHLVHENSTIPFDVSVVRVIQYNTSLPGAEEAKRALAAQIDTLHRTDPLSIRTPISTTLDIMAMARSHEPTERRLGDILKTLWDVKNALDRLAGNSSVPSQVLSIAEKWLEMSPEERRRLSQEERTEMDVAIRRALKGI